MSATKKAKLLFILLSILLSMYMLSLTPEALSYSENETKQRLNFAQQTILDCYKAAVKAEEAGAKVEELTETLNEAGNIYSRATLAFKSGDYDSTFRLASECVNILDGFLDEADNLYNEAVEAQQHNFAFLVCTGVGAIAVICVGFAVWDLLKRRYSSGKMKSRPQDYQVLLITVIFVSALILASPVLNRILVYPRTEYFTELWILDSNHKAENYPFNVSSGQEYSVYLGVSNHLGRCAYYIVQVKFRNETQPAPMNFGPIEERLPCSLPSLYNFTLFVADENVDERIVTFSMNYMINENSSKVSLQSMQLDSATLNVSEYVIGWNSTKRGFYGFLFFELWLYNEKSENFDYHGRFVGLWLNFTSTG